MSFPAKTALTRDALKVRPWYVVGPLRSLLRQNPGDTFELGMEKVGRRTVRTCKFKKPANTVAELLAQEMIRRALTDDGKNGVRCLERIINIADGARLLVERERAIKSVEHTTRGEQTGTITIIRGPAHQLQAHEENGNGNGHKEPEP